jgi:hypothetical protein
MVMAVRGFLAMDTEKELNRLNIARGDIKKAIELLEAAEKHDHASIEYEALIMGAIIHYARPFSCNEKSQSANALARVPLKVIEVYSPDEHTLHDRLIDRRNKTIAHAESEEFPTDVDRETKAIVSRRYSVYPEFLDPKPLIALSRKLLMRLQNMVADHVYKMSKKEFHE